jgi:succinate-semialdehyde dehydrogenase/glutarate-semialdehyde dehydrogenase
VVQTAPIGALLGIMPWNFPYYQVARFAAPNLLLGNTILLKHAENCPQQAMRIEALFTEAGVATHVYSNVLADTGQVAALIGDPRVRGVSLTGSERAGRAVGELAGKHIKKCVLELGGSDPLIVMPDADVAAAAEAALNGRLFNAGQACTAVKRIIVHDTVWDDFVSAFVRSAHRWTMGDPRDRETTLGPLASVTARDRLADQVRDAVGKGARVLLGGEVPQRAGAYFPVTVITDVTPEMRAHHEELFGPVAVLYRVRSTEEAVAVANDTPYGLGATVFSRDTVKANELAGRLEVGMVGINIAVRSSPELPFGGVKNSGVGRELGRFGIEEFANKKLKVEQEMAR